MRASATDAFVNALTIDPIAAMAAALLILLIIALVWAGSRRPFVREIERLKDDLHKALATGLAQRRLAVNGRPSSFVDITASINRLLDLSESAGKPAAEDSDLFDALAATLPEVALIHTNSILFANRAAGELLGIDSATLIGKQVTDLMRPAYRAVARKHVSTSLQGDEAPAPIEVQLISGDDVGPWVELYSARLTYKGELALLTVARDITHRKSLEASLGRGKLQARITLESIGEGVITTDRNGVIDYMNEAAEQLIGTNRASALGKRLLDLIALVDEVDRSSLGDPVQKCLAERRRINLGRRALLLSKQAEREFSTELTASPIRGPDGQIAGCVVIFHDVSELRGIARRDVVSGKPRRANGPRQPRASSSAGSKRRSGPRGRRRGPRRNYLDLDRFKSGQRHLRPHRRRQHAARDRGIASKRLSATPIPSGAWAAMSSACCWSVVRSTRRGRSRMTLCQGRGLPIRLAGQDL